MPNTIAASVMSTKVHIGTTKAIAAVPADFASDVFKEIKGLVEVGELGGTYETGQVDRIDTGVREKYKSVKELGELELSFVYLSGDAGQAAAEAAYAANAPYNFKLVLSTGDTFYFRALVMSTRIATGTASDTVRMIVTLARTDMDPVKVAA